MQSDRLINWRAQVEADLTRNILGFWSNYAIDERNGGFLGYIANDLTVDPQHPKACVLYARILWTFSAAYRIYHDSHYLQLATRAYHYLLDYFWDYENSGVYWQVDYQGQPLNPKKQSYALAFVIYGLSEYYQVTKLAECLNRAVELFKAIEKHCYDPLYQGYFEAFGRDWSSIADTELEAGEPAAIKTMNSHLHIMEAYTNLYRVWPNPALKAKLHAALTVMIERILDAQTCQLQLYFDAAWNCRSQLISFGHDIEGSWLLVETAKILKDSVLEAKVTKLAVEMAQQVYNQGIDFEHGGLFNAGIPGHISDPNKDWWPQAEAVVGFCNAYQLSGQEHFLKAAYAIWRFIDRAIIDHNKGEWFWGVASDGTVVQNREKVGPCKCPYHNSRMGFELKSRLAEILGEN